MSPEARALAVIEKGKSMPVVVGDMVFPALHYGRHVVAKLANGGVILLSLTRVWAWHTPSNAVIVQFDRRKK